MKIIADENIPLVKEAFSTLGNVHLRPGRTFSRKDVADADILLVRSVTKIDPELLAGSRVVFVGSATIGFDHIDLPYLSWQGIAFARAPGSNAVSAAEYVLSALLVLAERRGFQLREKTAGIIGYGNVGSEVKKKLTALGARCLINDPPQQAGLTETRQTETGEPAYVDLKTALAADIVTLHVPLEKEGSWPTYQLADTDFFAAMQPDAVFINTSRGAVVDEAALTQTLDTRPGFSAVLDVWANEPWIDGKLLQRTALGTPHIAGYSFDGKVRATEMLYTAVCEFLKIPSVWKAQAGQPAPPALSFSNKPSDETAIRSAVLACYDIRKDDAALASIIHTSDKGAYFDGLRKDYPIRREFGCVEICLPAERQILAELLKGIGFTEFHYK